MERKPKSWECAAFVTESGRRVIGCQKPGTFEDGNCNKIRFFSANGRPYYTMNTCSGGLQYAPQDPPQGHVHWFDPLWSGVAENERECQTPQCGLLGEVPPYYECARMLDTVDGDVRGCWNPYQFDVEGFCADVRLYDDEGDYLGTRSSCFEGPPDRPCGKGQCGVPNRVPDDWRCVRLGAVSSELDGEITPPLVACHNPTWEEAQYGDPKPEGICALFFDENNRPYEVWEQCGGSGNQIGSEANSAALDAFGALGHGGAPAPGPEPEGQAGDGPAEDEGADGASGGPSAVDVAGYAAADPPAAGENRIVSFLRPFVAAIAAPLVEGNDPNPPTSAGGAAHSPGEGPSEGGVLASATEPGGADPSPEDPSPDGSSGDTAEQGDDTAGRRDAGEPPVESRDDASPTLNAASNPNDTPDPDPNPTPPPSDAAGTDAGGSPLSTVARASDNRLLPVGAPSGLLGERGRLFWVVISGAILLAGPMLGLLYRVRRASRLSRGLIARETRGAR